MKNGKTGKYRGKKILTAALALALMLAAACGSAEGEASPSPSPTAAPSATPAVQLVKVATVSEIENSLNIRSAASTDSEILSEAYSGDRFEVLTENFSDGWHEIAYNGGKAYVSAAYVTVAQMDPAVLSATPAPTASPEPEDAGGDAGAAAAPTATPAPAETPSPENPIVVNGGGRVETSSSGTEYGMTAETIRDTEDPERR